MVKRVVLMIVFIFIVSGVAIAEEKKLTPEEEQAKMQQAMQMMKSYLCLHF